MIEEIIEFPMMETRRLSMIGPYPMARLVQITPISLYGLRYNYNS